MAFDKAARARQLQGCVAHTGDAFLFSPRDLPMPIEWVANCTPETAPGTGKLNVLVVTGRQKLTGSRATFSGAGRIPKVGEFLTDTEGNLYTIAQVPPDPLNPLLVLICTVTPSAPSLT